MIDKKSDKDITKIVADGECSHDDLEVDDYNFDGFQDFSVFDSYASGQNTTRLYI